MYILKFPSWIAFPYFQAPVYIYIYISSVRCFLSFSSFCASFSKFFVEHQQSQHVFLFPQPLYSVVWFPYSPCCRAEKQIKQSWPSWIRCLKIKDTVSCNWIMPKGQSNFPLHNSCLTQMRIPSMKCAVENILNFSLQIQNDFKIGITRVF